MNDTNLKPCPFCGGEVYFDAVDRIINIGCDVCMCHRCWRGLITPEPHEVRVNEYEYYNPKAHEEAIEAWNRREFRRKLKTKKIVRKGE